MNQHARISAQSESPAGLNFTRRARSVSPLSSRASEPVRLVFWLQLLAGMSVQLGLLLWLMSWKGIQLDPAYRSFAVISVLGAVPTYAICRVYSISGGYLVGLGRLFVAWTTLMAALVFLTFITKTSELFSRQVVLAWFVGGYVLQGLIFVPLHRLAGRAINATRNYRRSIIIGRDELAHALADVLEEPLLGLVEADDLGRSAIGEGDRVRATTYPLLGNVVQLRRIIRDYRISRVYIALPAEMTGQIEALYVDLLDSNVDVLWIPDLANLMLLNHSVQSVGGLPAVHLNESPLTSQPGSAFLKAAMDRSLALLGILALSPLLVTIAMAVKLSSPGPVFFRQQRHGMNGNIIEVLKFRSMLVHDDKEVRQAQKNDSRVTPVGRFIRRTSIDELPQLFNVFKGEMSLVGPRPHAVAHNDYYSDKIMAYMARHRIKPGITGHAQINGYRGETETLDKMQKRVEMDLEYINNWSLWLDIKILIKTPLSLLSENVY